MAEMAGARYAVRMACGSLLRLAYTPQAKGQSPSQSPSHVPWNLRRRIVLKRKQKQQSRTSRPLVAAARQAYSPE